MSAHRSPGIKGLSIQHLCKCRYINQNWRSCVWYRTKDTSDSAKTGVRRVSDNADSSDWVRKAYLFVVKLIFKLLNIKLLNYKNNFDNVEILIGAMIFKSPDSMTKSNLVLQEVVDAIAISWAKSLKASLPTRCGHSFAWSGPSPCVRISRPRLKPDASWMPFATSQKAWPWNIPSWKLSLCFCCLIHGFERIRSASKPTPLRTCWKGSARVNWWHCPFLPNGAQLVCCRVKQRPCDTVFKPMASKPKKLCGLWFFWPAWPSPQAQKNGWKPWFWRCFPCSGCRWFLCFEPATNGGFDVMKGVW